MNQRAKHRRGWRVGDLAKATGLTVRTLHHYEHVGLLSPPSRTDARHRIYDANDVRRLYQVCALRDIGLPLPEIRRVLDDRPSLREVLREHAARVEAEVMRLQRLKDLLRHACEQVNRVAADDLLVTIDAMTKVYRRADIVQTDRRTREPSKRVEARWRKLGTELRACMRAHEPPSSRRVRALARRAQTYLAKFAGNDGATLDALAHLRRAAPPKKLAGWTPALMQYLDQALAELAKEDQPC